MSDIKIKNSAIAIGKGAKASNNLNSSNEADILNTDQASIIKSSYKTKRVKNPISKIMETSLQIPVGIIASIIAALLLSYCGLQ